MVDWERSFRGNGIIAVVLFIVAYVIYGSQPKVGASAEELVSFYDGHRTRILIATVVLCFAVLCLIWFAVALSSALRDAGRGAWGAAATAAGAALGAVFFVHQTLSATLAYSIAGSGNTQITSGLNDLSWVLTMLGSFPTAMLVMAGSFGLWRAGIFSNASFAAGVTAMALILLGATTWAGDGFWAPSGAYVRFAIPIIALVWVAAVSGLLVRRPSPASVPDGAAVPAA
jgi:hypothetical protein